MTGLLGLGPARPRLQLALLLAPSLLWVIPWFSWVVYLHTQPGGATIEWIVVGAFAVGPTVARLAARTGRARMPGLGLFAIELTAIAALCFGRIEPALTLGVLLCAGLTARGQAGQEAPVWQRLSQLAVLVACAGLGVGYAYARPSMELRILLAFPLLYEAFRGPSGGDAAVRRIAGAAAITALALCRYEPLWGVALGAWCTGSALFTLRGGGRRRAARVLAAGLACLLGLVVLEVAVRVRNVAPPAPASLTGLGPTPGSVPVWEGKGAKGEQIRNPIHWNDPPLGPPMHDVVHTLRKPEGTRRVLVLGDSFVEGVHVPTDALYHRQLGAALSSKARPVEALSLARSGWGQVEELHQLREVGVRYAPDLVLVEFLPINDVRDNMPELDALVHEENVRSSWALPLSFDASAKGLASVAVLAEQTDRLWRWATQGTTDRLGNQVYLPQPTRSPELWATGWERTEAALLAMSGAAHEANARFAVVIFPSPGELEREGLDHPAQRVVEFCRANDLPVLDLTPAFAADPDWRSAYLHPDEHWSRRGHALAAEFTARWVEEQKFLR